MEIRKPITEQEIDTFINGRDTMTGIVNIEYQYRNDYVEVYYRDANDQKHISKEPFYPFLYATKEACRKMCGGDRNKVRSLMQSCHIAMTGMSTCDNEGNVVAEMEKGYTVRIQATQPMSYAAFREFFDRAGNPISKRKISQDDTDSESRLADDNSQYYTITPKEQFLIYTGKRYFKGYDDYNQLLRMVIDLETTGLDTNKDRIEKIGIRFNKKVISEGKEIEFQRIYEVLGTTKEERDKSELRGIRWIFWVISKFQPDIITAHNGEAFDWYMVNGACKRLGTTMADESREYLGQAAYKSRTESVLKLGGEVEKFSRTIIPGTIVTDSLHAVRRAQALDSDFQEGNLKFATKYLGIAKKNRVYVPGNRISEIGNDETERYAFCDETGDWYIYDAVNGELSAPKVSEPKEKFVLHTRNKIYDGYVLKSGKYIIDRYLLDDIWECDVVEAKLNATNFLICKMLPIPFEKCCTMGTATQWKALMTAWSYENNLAIPFCEDNPSFTGGLARVLKLGYVSNAAKLDYNSLYPSTELTWGISTKKDISGAMPKFLNYMLTNREKYKKLKKNADKIISSLEKKMNDGETLSEEEIFSYQKARQDYELNDKKQSQVKAFCNSFFGAFGSKRGSVYPWSDVDAAERTTCTGRMCLRLMINHFKTLGYEPIVGDSFTEDTPVFVRLKGTNMVQIIPVKNLFDKNRAMIDALGREYFMPSDYQVYCRSGWEDVSYIYRHKTDKDIYKITDESTGMEVEVTEDHSLFNADKEKIKPSTINENSLLEYKDYPEMDDNFTFKDESVIDGLAEDIASGKMAWIPGVILKCNKAQMSRFYLEFMKHANMDINYSKTVRAGLNYIKRKIQKP